MPHDSVKRTRLINYLREELAVPASAISLALRQAEHTPNLIPTILWQYGIITIEQLDRIFDWMETA